MKIVRWIKCYIWWYIRNRICNLFRPLWWKCKWWEHKFKKAEERYEIWIVRKFITPMPMSSFFESGYIYVPKVDFVVTATQSDEERLAVMKKRIEQMEEEMRK